MRIKIVFDLIGLLLGDVLGIGVEQGFEGVFVFVDEGLKLVFLLVEFFYFEISKSHFLFLEFHLGEFRKREFREVVEAADFDVSLTVEGLDFLELDKTAVIECNLNH